MRGWSPVASTGGRGRKGGVEKARELVAVVGSLAKAGDRISADTIADKRGHFYYLVTVRTKKTALVYHNEVLPIIPGMMVQADILIGKKTVLQYMLKPILKAKQNALTER